MYHGSQCKVHLHLVPLKIRICLDLIHISCPPQRKGWGVLHPLHKPLQGGRAAEAGFGAFTWYRPVGLVRGVDV